MSQHDPSTETNEAVPTVTSGTLQANKVTAEPIAAPPAQESTTDWKAEARKWEARAKENHTAAQQLQKIEDEKKSAEERATAAAQKAEQRANDALKRVASAEARAALTGVVSDPKAFVEDMDLTRFITSEGEIDSDAISKLTEKYSSLAPAKQTLKPNPAQNANGSKPNTEGQLTRENLKSMSTEQILEAQSKGLLNDALGIK